METNRTSEIASPFDPVCQARRFARADGVTAILVPVWFGEAGSRLVRAAASLARDYGARLIGLASGLPAPPHDSHLGMVIGSYSTADAKRASGLLEASRAGFLAEVTPFGIACEYRSEVNFPAFALSDAANAADLLVVAKDGPSSAALYQDLAVGDLLLAVGRPVLMTSANRPDLNLKAIAVAWKNCRESRRMITDALPLLQRANRVHLLHVREPLVQADSVEDAQAFLAGHGIPTIPHLLACQEGVGRTIVNRARELKADAIFAGAYGHTRFREWCLGGVTRTLLSDCPLPVLLSH